MTHYWGVGVLWWQCLRCKSEDRCSLAARRGGRTAAGATRILGALRTASLRRSELQPAACWAPRSARAYPRHAAQLPALAPVSSVCNIPRMLCACAVATLGSSVVQTSHQWARPTLCQCAVKPKGRVWDSKPAGEGCGGCAFSTFPGWGAWGSGLRPGIGSPVYCFAVCTC